MPGWPFLPLVVLAAFVLMGTGQTRHDLYITLGVAVVALAYYLGYLRPRSGSRWVLLGAVEEGGSEPAEELELSQSEQPPPVGWPRNDPEQP